MPKICKICRQSDMLCSGCNKLLREGMLTRTDIDVARAIEKMKLNASFTRTIDYSSRIIIIAGKDAGRIIGKSGKNAKELSRILGKEIDVIEEGNEKKMIEKMLRVPTVGINKVYGGVEKYKVRVEKRFRLQARADSMLMSKVLAKPVEIIFE
jgi:transcription antitermination factor NusA-like protein